MKQRIALVAASALTAGFLSVVAMPTANAVAELTVTTTTGVVVAPTTTASVGTGTIAATGTVKLAVAAAAASTAIQVRISGGTFTGVTSGADISADGTTATNTTNTTAIVGLDAKPTGAGRNMVIKTYLAASGTAAVDTSALNASVTAHSSYTFTVVAAASSGVASAGDSKVVFLNNGSAGTTITAGSMTTDLAYANVVGAGALGMLGYNIYDANKTILGDSTTTTTATVKSGACVVGTTITNATITSAYATASSGAFYVAQSDYINTPAITCTVEVAANGVVVATKTFIFQGPVATITVSSIKRGQTAASAQPNTGMGYLTAADSAGNAIGGVVITGAIVTATDVAYITAVTGNTTTQSAASVNGGVVGSTTAPATIGWTCSGTNTDGVGIKFKTPNGIGGYIYSSVYQAACANSPATYTAGLDKASYVPGDIATLTITAKDSKGILTNNAVVLGSGSTSELISISGSNMTAVTAPAANDTFSTAAGVKTYKFIVGATEGSYNMVVDLPKWNSSTYSQAAVTVPYKIASSTATVSNAQVLQSIVALIASINKQIQALQALILKKK